MREACSINANDLSGQRSKMENLVKLLNKVRTSIYIGEKKKRVRRRELGGTREANGI